MTLWSQPFVGIWMQCDRYTKEKRRKERKFSG